MKIFTLFIISIFSLSLFAEKPFKIRQKVVIEEMKTLPYKLKNPWPKGFSKKLPQSLIGKELCFVGDTGGNSPETKAIASIVGRTCSIVWHVGDMVYDMGIKDLNDPELKTQFLNHYSPFKVPWYLTFGNHDYYGNIEAWLELGKQTPNLNFPHYYYAQNLNGLCFVMGDTSPMESGTTAPRFIEQDKWIKDLYPIMKNECKFSIFMAHHSYIGAKAGRNTPPSIMKFYEDNILGKFDLVIAGHDHLVGYVGNINGTEQFISGSGGKMFAAKDTVNPIFKFYETAQPGYITLKFNNQNTAELSIRTPNRTIFKKIIQGKGIR